MPNHPTPAEIAAEMRELVAEADLSPAEIKLLLLMTAVERVDRFMVWLEHHVATAHDGDDCTSVVLETIGVIRSKLSRELHVADDAADLVLL